MNQKLFIKRIFLVFVVVLFIASCAISEKNYESTTIYTSSGIVQGTTKDKVVNWKDIPYALPPIGELRWKAPRKIINSDQEILPQSENGCLQEASIYAGLQGEGIVGQEDCLYLDIQAPKNALETKLPVMFWIHGGGNTSGTKDYYDFSELVDRHQVLVVKINYRLGPMGWFTHPAIQDFQKGLDKTSNFGTLDIIQALKWVQNNISEFGGDPKNVTIFGESAGGHNVLSLLSSPLSDGLFHKAISQSGYTTTYTTDQAIGINASGEIENALGSDQVLVQHDSSGYGSIKKLFEENPIKYAVEYQRYLRSIDGKKLLETYKYIADESVDRLPLTTRDGLLINFDGMSAGLRASKNKNSIPVIAGSNKDELSLWLSGNRYFVKSSFPLSKLIPIPKVEFRKKDLYKLWVKIRSQGWKLRGVDEPLMELEKAGYDSLYSYRFDWDDQRKSYFLDFPNLMGSAHGLDIAFVTGNFKFGPLGRYVYPKGKSRDQMQETMMNAWTSFAKTGIPNTGKDVKWEKFNSNDRIFIKLDSDEFLSLDKEMLSMEYILGSLKLSPVGSLLEKCMLARETLDNIGDPLLDELGRWNEGACNQFDLNKERKKIEDDLIQEYGSVSIYGQFK